MKRSTIFGLVSLIALAGLWLQYPVNAKPEPFGPVLQEESGRGRYELGTFFHQSTLTPGYYILDTRTGTLWTGRRDEKPRKISGPLSE